MLYLANGSKLIPSDIFQKSKMMEWLFWEQRSHVTTIATCRFHHTYLKKPLDGLDQTKIKQGNEALDLMNQHLSKSDWFIGNNISLADIALVAYTRLAHEGGFDLSTRSSVLQWIKRTESVLNIT